MEFCNKFTTKKYSALLSSLKEVGSINPHFTTAPVLQTIPSLALQEFDLTIPICTGVVTHQIMPSIRSLSLASYSVMCA